MIFSELTGVLENLPLNEEVQIHFSPVWCQLTSNNSERLHEILFNALSYQVEGYFYSPKFQMGMWDGYNRLYKPKTRRFRSGLLPKVLDVLERNGCSITVEGYPEVTTDYILRSSYRSAKGQALSPRPYQLDAVKHALYYRFGIIQAPPRAGKTLIATMAIDAEPSEYPVNFFVRSKDLASQTYEVFKQNFPGCVIGYVCDGECEIGDINVITIQSAFSAYNKKFDEKVFSEEKVVEKKQEVREVIRVGKKVFYDEVHHGSSASSKFILDKCVNANMKIGLSATPFSDRLAAVATEEVIGPVIYKIGYSELIQAGFLMKPYIYLYKLPKRNFEGTYNAVYKQAVVEDPFINSLLKKVVDVLVSKGKSIVIQTEFVNHSKKLAAALQCDYLVGSDTTEKRQQIIADLTDKKILCVVSTLFEEGLDLASLDYTINLAGGLSNITTFQRMRSITAHESKTTIGIIDFIHQCKYLKNHSKKRKDLYESEPEFVVEIRDVSKLKEIV